MEKRLSHVGGEDPVEQLLLCHVEGALQLVVVEGDLAGARAVEPRLHERGPCVLQQEAAAHVVLADACHPREDHLAAVILHRRLAQEEVGEAADLIDGDEVGLWRRGSGRSRRGRR